jgi:hypothetical protein
MRGKNPTRRQKQRLRRLHLDPRMWLIRKDAPTCFEVMNRVSGEVRRLGA